MLKITDYLKENGIITNVEAPERHELIEKFGDLFFPENIEKKSELIKLLNKRESLGSTGIGRGYAIAHTRTLLTEKIEIGIITTKGTDYNSIDNEPVYFAFGIIAPYGEIIKQYLPLLSATAFLINSKSLDGIIKRIKKQEEINPNEILNIILDYEKQTIKN